jgi:hypothetical protein
VAITESERYRLARALCDLEFTGTETDEDHNAKITAVIGHLEPDEDREVMKLAKAMIMRGMGSRLVRIGKA